MVRFLPAFSLRRIALALFAVLHMETAFAASIRDGLVGYWPFDDRTGRVAADASGLGQPGTLINFTTNNNNHWVLGQIEGALEFRGTSYQEYVRVAEFIKPTNTMSLSAWVYADSYSQWATIAKNFGVVGAFWFSTFGSTPNLSLYSAERSEPTGTTVNYTVDFQPLAAGTWNHVAFVADGANIRIWRNGVLVASARYNGTINNSTPHLEIGGYPGGSPGQGYWDGKIDDLGFWTRALSATEMREIYLAGLAGRPLTSVNVPPTISAITNRSLIEDAPPLQIPFTVSDVETLAAELDVRATSSNPSVIKNSDLVLSGQTSARSLTLNLVPDGHGTTVITVTVIDSGGATSSRVFTVVVAPQNDPPVAQSQTVTIAEDSRVAITLGATDVDGDALRFTPNPPQFGEATYTNGVVRYIPPRDFVGADSFTFTALDGELQSPSATVTINITAVNDAPVAVATLAPVFVPPVDLPNVLVLSGNGSNALVHFDASGSSDVDSSVLQFSWTVEGESFATSALASRILPIGHYTVSVAVNDGELTSTANVTFDVVTAGDAINLLVLAIDRANLPRKEQRPLIATLKGAMSALDRGDTTAATGQLQAFLRKLHVQLDPADPLLQSLQTGVQEVIDALSAD